jgi:2-oxoglutarate ferredoxin oxidoreductase subunit alpha
MAEIKLMCGNEAIAWGAMRSGCDAYFGYPITPQSEIMETLMAEQPWEQGGMTVLQAESETAAINMLYGAAATGKRCMTSSSSPGISLMNEGISYIAGADLPCLIVDITRGGPGLGTIQPSQADYFQATKGGGHGDYHPIVLAPASVQEMYDFVALGFDLAFKYHNPVMLMADGVVGEMMEKVTLTPARPRFTDAEVLAAEGAWALTGRRNRERNIVTSLNIDPLIQEEFNKHLQEKYRRIRENEARCEMWRCDDAEYVMVAYGISARIAQKAAELLRDEGVRVGVFRLITLYPFPTNEIAALVPSLKGILCVEMSAGQMIEDVQLTVKGAVPVFHYGRMGGMVHNPTEVLDAFKTHYK